MISSRLRSSLYLGVMWSGTKYHLMLRTVFVMHNKTPLRCPVCSSQEPQDGNPSRTPTCKSRKARTSKYGLQAHTEVSTFPATCSHIQVTLWFTRGSAKDWLASPHGASRMVPEPGLCFEVNPTLLLPQLIFTHATAATVVLFSTGPASLAQWEH